tara:strand:- start:64465 stop:65121 length:657 start_codon:yes stop_codon:yes gene_type:complete
MIEWLVTCLYTVSTLLLLLSVWFLFSIFKISWWFPFKVLKLLIALLLSIILFISADQLSGFFISSTGTKVAEINIRYLEDQKYLVILTKPESPISQFSYEINGDEWLLDLRLISWHRILASFGIDTLFRLERIGGRYQSLENELSAKRSIYSLNSDKVSDDLLSFVAKLYDGNLFRAYYGSVLYGPMSDQASFGVFLTESGAEVLPLNEIAKKALNGW